MPRKAKEKPVIRSNSGLKDITRIEGDMCFRDGKRSCSESWLVRINFKGKSYRQYFNDRDYGGKLKARKAAIEWRNETEKQIGKPRTDRIISRGIAAKSNTGVVGVARRLHHQRKRGRQYTWDVFEVTWSPAPGKLSRSRISINKHGEKKAFAMAKKLRREKDLEFYGCEIPTMRARKTKSS